jgi:hypothetical protein
MLSMSSTLHGGYSLHVRLTSCLAQILAVVPSLPLMYSRPVTQIRQRLQAFQGVANSRWTHLSFYTTRLDGQLNPKPEDVVRGLMKIRPPLGYRIKMPMQRYCNRLRGFQRTWRCRGSAELQHESSRFFLGFSKQLRNRHLGPAQFHFRYFRRLSRSFREEVEMATAVAWWRSEIRMKKQLDVSELLGHICLNRYIRDPAGSSSGVWSPWSNTSMRRCGSARSPLAFHVGGMGCCFFLNGLDFDLGNHWNPATASEAGSQKLRGFWGRNCETSMHLLYISILYSLYTFDHVCTCVTAEIAKEWVSGRCLHVLPRGPPAHSHLPRVAGAGAWHL